MKQFQKYCYNNKEQLNTLFLTSKTILTEELLHQLNLV